MDELTERFEQDRAHLRAVAHRMLGSLSEAEDAVQETWLRATRSPIRTPVATPRGSLSWPTRSG